MTQKCGQIAHEKCNNSGFDTFLVLVRKILRCSNQNLRRRPFLKKISTILLDFSGNDAIFFAICDGGVRYISSLTNSSSPVFKYEYEEKKNHLLEVIAKSPPCAINFTDLYSEKPLLVSSEVQQFCCDFFPDTHSGSLIIMPIWVDENTYGVMLQTHSEPGYLKIEEERFCKEFALTLGMAIADRRVQYAFRERVKEVTCLYKIARIIDQSQLTHSEKLQEIVSVLPMSWHYADLAVAQIIVDKECYKTPGFDQGVHTQYADIVVRGSKRGSLEVSYTAELSELGPNIFLKEEVTLLDEVARQIVCIIEKEDDSRERQHCQAQLLHADRLARIGQLAAGVAHELNEPLNSILGFAQLAQKNPSDTEQLLSDLDRIVKASLYARDIVRKLLVFSRQVPAKKSLSNLNFIVEESLQILKGRCAREGIEVIYRFSEIPPIVLLDPAQMKQVLVNLAVNATHAMPDGGKLTVQTSVEGSWVYLVVKDTGIGIKDTIKDKIFLPFFTTKDLHEGTGLGLSVVHGIVTAHKGQISVDSKPGTYTRFEVRLPIGEK